MNRNNLRLQLGFFILYTILLLYGIGSQIEHTDALWVLFFCAGAFISYWAHSKTGVIVIVLLALHTTFEIIHHGGSLNTLSLLSGITLAIHLLFDVIFIKIEIQKHTRKPEIIFKGILVMYILFFLAALVLSDGNEHGHHESNAIEGILVGGILVCALSHGAGLVKRLSRRTY